MRLQDLFDEFSFLSTRQGTTTVYSAALFNRSSIRQKPVTRRVDEIIIPDLPDLPELSDVINRTENSLVPIADDDDDGIVYEDGASAVIEQLGNATAQEDEQEAVSNEAARNKAGAAVTSTTARTENPSSRPSNGTAMSLRLRPQTSLRATARLRDRSQRRDEERRSRSGGMRRNRA